MRNYNIDILRGFSILLVLIHHFNIPYKLDDTFFNVQIFGENLTTLVARNGNYGVTIFFVISGFLITQHLLRKENSCKSIDLKNFYIRRIARIFPCLILLIVMVTALKLFGLSAFMNHAPRHIEVSYGMTILSALTFWMNILIIENGWVNYALGVLWSLSVEEIFYLVFPLLYLVLGRGKGLILVLCAVIMYAPYFRSLHFAQDNEAYLYHYFSSFDAIAMGCLTALYTPYKSMHSLSRMTPIVLIVLMVALYLYAPIKEVSTWSMSVFALLTAMLILCWSKPQHQEKDSVVLFKVLIWIGQRSYEIYLFHLVILGMFKVIYMPKVTLPYEKTILLVAYFILVFTLSWVIEKYYSTPLNLKIRHRFIDKK